MVNSFTWQRLLLCVDARLRLARVAYGAVWIGLYAIAKRRLGRVRFRIIRNGAFGGNVGLNFGLWQNQVPVDSP